MFSRSYKNQKNVEKGFALNLAKEHLTLIQQKMPSTFSQLTLNNMTGFEILSQLMLKCQQKKYLCVFKKISLK